MADTPKKTTRRRKSTAKKAEPVKVEPEVTEAPKPSLIISEEDRVSPISLENRGPRMGLTTYISSENVDFTWHNTRTGEPVGLPQPLAVRVKKEGGDYYRLELFFPNSPENEIGSDRFDNKTFTILLERNEESGKRKGRRFKGLVGAGWGRDSLAVLNPELKFLKYVCHTKQMSHFDEVPKSLKGLAAPHQR